jgi:hypothetical protein
VEAWEFIVGGGASYNHLNGMYTVTNPEGRDANNDKVLDALTHLRAFMEGLEFVRMRRDTTTVVDGVPAGAIARCISELGRQYAFYLHHSVLRTSKYVVRPGLYRDSPAFDLPPGRYTAEWIDPASGRVVSQESFRHHGGRITLDTPPFVVDVALRLIGDPL